MTKPLVVLVLVAQLCPTLCNPMDFGLPGSSVHGILQARILEWIAIPFSKTFSELKKKKKKVSHFFWKPYYVAQDPVFNIWWYWVLSQNSEAIDTRKKKCYIIL